jgi:L-alanine-DL-glutamate epimerase-like enolase superfamily enzyme
LAEAPFRFEVIPYSLPFREKYVTSKGSIDRRELILLKLSGDDGVVGLGEAVPLALRGGSSTAVVVAEIEEFLSGSGIHSLGSPFGEARPGHADSLSTVSPPAACAIRTALADLGAKRAGLPLFRYLAPEAEPLEVELNATLGADDPVEVRSEAADWAGAGFETFKVKVGDENDLERVSAVREELGDGPKIRLDANGSWTPEDAVMKAERLMELDIELFEEPVSGLDRLARFREQTGAVVVADESVNNAVEASRARELGACDAVTVKLSKIGSLDSSLGGYLPTYLSSALDGPVGIAAALHVAMTPGARAGAKYAQGLATGRLFSHTVTPGRQEWLEGPVASPPEDPGLGIELDEEALATFRL